MTTTKETFAHRDARAEDIGQLAALLSRTPDDGTAWQFPGVDDDGQFLFKGMLNWLKEPFTSTSKRIRVVEAEDGTLAALSIWLRRSRNADGEIVAEDWAERVPEAELEAIVAAASASFDEANPTEPRKISPVAHRSKAINDARDAMLPSPRLETPSLHLYALGVHPNFRRRGLAKQLVRWGQDRAAERGVPAYVSAEMAGVMTYRACGFQIIEDTQFWLASDGSRIEQDDPAERWRRENGGCYMAESLWVPPGHTVEIRGKVYKGEGV